MCVCLFVTLCVCVCDCVCVSQVRTGNGTLRGLGSVRFSPAGGFAALLLLQEAGSACPVGQRCNPSAGGSIRHGQISCLFLHVKVSLPVFLYRHLSYNLRSQGPSIYRAASALDGDTSKVYV